MMRATEISMSMESELIQIQYPADASTRRIEGFAESKE